MADKEPMAEPFRADDATVTPWAEVCAHLERAPDTYWLATVRPNGRPHVMPLLAVWVDGRLHFCASATTRKARNLARNSYCVITVENEPIDLVVEGEAAKVSDEAKLQLVADAYASKYEWPVTVRDGAFYGDGAPTAGPPPYEVYEVTPTTAFGFGTDGTLKPTRWRF
jgi:nitroimidazol reductase NimA-like FMN-containing flavoprotein (pyridoxamine 5'-phosphate oxidase superfamily)